MLLILTMISFIVVFVCLYDVATSYPGYQPLGEITKKEFDQMPTILTIKSNTVYLKHCPTCKIVRDLRTFHCKKCGRCIERHDHHCIFLGNCIGKYNTKKFIYFLLSVVAHSLIILVTILVKFFEISWPRPEAEWEFNVLIAVFVALIAGIFFLIMTCLLGFHLYLIINNITTNEYIRSKQNLYNNGLKENFSEVFCV